VDQNKFLAILPIITAALAEKIAKAYNLDENGAIEKLYTTKLYSYLENEETKVWQYSVDKMFDLYRQEVETGSLELPEY
jgi:hypothetical protein